MSNNNLIEMKRVLFADNVSTAFAEKHSKKYPNAIFFTTEGDIYKAGILYTRIRGVDPNNNTLTIDGQDIKLIVNENNLLAFTSTPKWYWYVGPESRTKILQGEVRNYNEDKWGWRLIEDIDEGNALPEPEPDQNPFLFDPSKDFSKTNKPIYYTIKRFPDDPDFNINVHPAINTKKDNVYDMYIYLPKKLVDNYGVGVYDSNNRTNFIKESNLIETIKYNGNEYIQTFNGVQYNCYKITGKNFGCFNLCIYANPTEKNIPDENK